MLPVIDHRLKLLYCDAGIMRRSAITRCSEPRAWIQHVPRCLQPFITSTQLRLYMTYEFAHKIRGSHHCWCLGFSVFRLKVCNKRIQLYPHHKSLQNTPDPIPLLHAVFTLSGVFRKVSVSSDPMSFLNSFSICNNGRQ